MRFFKNKGGYAEFTHWKGAVALWLVCSLSAVHALEITQEAWEKIQKRLDDQDARLAGAGAKIEGSTVDSALDSKYGPNANVSTKSGKLTISGLVQIWYYRIQPDRQGFFNDPNDNHIADSSSFVDSNGFRVRRTDIKFSMDINENVRAVMMIDPAREAIGFPGIPNNQVDLFGTKKANLVSPQYLTTFKPVGVNNTLIPGAVQNGGTYPGAPRLLQDAYINWHDCIPHHDIQVGQFIPWVSEEGLRPSGELDFAERSMIGFYGNGRDVGLSVHGSWWECESTPGNGRFQYWVGVFDGAGTYFEPGNQQNRPDTNDQKDLNARFLVRPLWDDCWGKLEMGVAFMGGRHGQGDNERPIAVPSNNLNRPSNWAVHNSAWGSYKFGNVMSGLWARTEWAWIKDREAPGSVIDVLGQSTGTNHFAQESGQAFSRQGFYGAMGYKLRDSRICDLLAG